MHGTRVRWSVRLPWSTAIALQRLVHLDGPGRPGDILGRAVTHLLDQPAAVVEGLAAQLAHGRAHPDSDRTQVVSMRMDGAVVARLQAWQGAHPAIALSWLTDVAIRTYLLVCRSTAADIQAVARGLPGMRPRRYRRLPALVVVVDGPHAA